MSLLMKRVINATIAEMQNRRGHIMFKGVQKITSAVALTVTLVIFSSQANADSTVEPYASSAIELEREKLSDIVRAMDKLVVQIDQASNTGAATRVQFNYAALKRDVLSRRELVQRYINSSWDVPRSIPALSGSYNN